MLSSSLVFGFVLDLYSSDYSSSARQNKKKEVKKKRTRLNFNQPCPLQ